MPARYNQIGKTYTSTRAADPRIVEKLVSMLALGPGTDLIDIGAGTGNYSRALAQRGFKVQAVEPSAVMRAQARPHENLCWVEASAESLPFGDNSFDGAVMTLCIHHFSDWQKGLSEALRVSNQGPLVLFAFDIEYESNFWLFDYFPQFKEIDKTLRPRIDEIEQFVTNKLKFKISMELFPLPSDLIDHFACADWARPENYLQRKFRDGISTFHKLDDSVRANGLKALQADLDSGRWHERYGAILESDHYDFGYLFMRISQ